MGAKFERNCTPSAGQLSDLEASMTTVETALGPIPTTELGPTLMHEHIVTRSPGVHENWPHLMDRPGIRTIVDLTTVDLGRAIDLIVDVARRSRVHVIVATGVWWMPQRYFNVHGIDEVAALFDRVITQGIGTSGVKAAIVKCATDTAGVTPVIENVLRASARAQKATGVPISTHTWAAGRSGEAQQAIFAQEGVDLSRVIIGHSDRFGLEHYLPTAKRVEGLARLCAEGYAGKMVLSHDANDDILPALRKAGVTDDQIEQMLVGNPRAIFEAAFAPKKGNA